MRLLFLILLLPFLSYSQRAEVHGHRGFRGFYPENTLTGFKEAVKVGADFIELDVIISKDSQVVVSHEPWFNPDICTAPDGTPVTKSTKGNLHEMNYNEIRKYDCGNRGNKKFPEQAKIPEYKPLLSEVIEQMETYCRENNLAPTRYNIEIKNSPAGDRKYHFDTKTTVALFHAVLKKYNINDRIIVQSFDMRCLREIHRLDPSLKTSLLIANPRSVKRNIRKLGFTPTYYSPAMKLCKKRTVTKAQKAGCKVAVWTVNEDKDVRRFLSYGVDAIITDYPNIFMWRKK